jgi:hypothetical protein
MGVAGSCTAGLWEESEWDRGRHRRRNSQVGTATCLPAGRAEPTMATQPLSRTLKPAVPGGHAIWSARVLASTGRCVTRQPGTRPTSPTGPTGPTPDVAAKSPRGGWQRHPDVRWSESRAILPYGRNHKATEWRVGVRQAYPGGTKRGPSDPERMRRGFNSHEVAGGVPSDPPTGYRGRAPIVSSDVALSDTAGESFGSVFACCFAPRLRRDRLRRGYHGSARRPRSSGT